jgi:branched-subunit amino acid ABC-type transport system permease component
MSSLLPFVITGVVTGSLYGLAGLGLVLTYRTSGVFNFGHGALGAGAAFLFYTLHVTHGWPWPPAALITLFVFGLLGGWLMELITRGLGDVPEAVVVVATVGVLLAVQGTLFLIYGNRTRLFPDFLPTSGVTLMGVNITLAQMISVAIATASAVALYVFLRQSRLGVSMRAVVDNPTLVALSGESPVRIRRTAWAIGSAFAAMSGILLAPTLGLDATLLTLLVIQAFGACAVGMFSSLPLTYAGGIGIGVAASLATRYLTEPPFQGIPPAVPFLVLVVVLLAVPVAKFPKRRASLRSLIADTKPMPFRRAAPMAVVGLLVLLAVPAVVGTRLPVWIVGLTYMITFSSLALLVWTSGQTSLCHAAFVAVGATTMSHLTTGWHLPWLVALVLAGLITAPVGALVAIPAIRLSGLYLALATLGFGVLMQQVIFPTALMFDATLSVRAPRPDFGPFHGAQDEHFYYLVLGVTVCAVLATVFISRSRLGRLLRAMSEAPTMLSTMGLGVNMTRLIVFCVSAFFAGVAGALTVAQFGGTGAGSYGPLQSLTLLAALTMCGTRLIQSPIYAAAFIGVFPAYSESLKLEFLATYERQTLLFGLSAIGVGIMIAKREEIAAFFARPSAARPVAGPARRPRPPSSSNRARERTAVAARGVR